MITRARVDGMTCQHCVRAVFTALTPVEGIIRADVSIGAIEVEHDGRATLERIRDVVAVAGYVVRDGVVERRRLPITDNYEL